MRARPNTMTRIPFQFHRLVANSDPIRRVGAIVKPETAETAGRQLLVTLILLGLLALPAFAAELRLTVKGVRSDKGEILIGIYKDPEAFAHAIADRSKRGLMPDSGRLVGCSIRAQIGSQSTVFTQLTPGRYAVAVIHDENDNGRLDRTFLGVPIEGYGFSNDRRGFFGAPSFDAASIVIGDGDVSTFVTLVYP